MFKVISLFYFFLITTILEAKDSEWYFQQSKKKFEQTTQTRGLEKIQKLEEAIVLSNSLFYKNENNFFQQPTQKKKPALQTASLYYQRKDFVNAIYFFRLAQLSTPFDTEIQKNILAVKRKLTKDPYFDSDNFIYPNLIFLKLEFFSFTWIIAFIGILNMIFWGLLTTFYLKKILNKKLILKTLTAIVLIFIFIFVGFLSIKESQKNTLAITKYKTNLYQGPGVFFTQLSSAPQGEEFIVNKKKKYWLQIKTATSQYYWIKKQDVFLY